MKKRRIAIVAFLLVACMVIGLGYAAISRKLTVNSNAHGIAGTLDVYFTEATKGANCVNAKLDGDENAALSATFTTTDLTTVGSSATATFKITNKETVDQINAKIDYLATNNTNASYYDVAYEFVATGDDADAGVTISSDKQSVTMLPYGQSVNIVVTVTLKAGVTDPTQASTIGIDFTAESLPTVTP